MLFIFFFQAEDGIRDKLVTGVQTCALPISASCVDGSGGCAFCATTRLLFNAPSATKPLSPNHRRLEIRRGKASISRTPPLIVVDGCERLATGRSFYFL